MTSAQDAMTTWVGTLSRAGVVPAREAEAGEAVAAFVVGVDRLEELRRFFAAAQPAEVARERRGAVEVCIAMAHSDRDVHTEERHILKELVGTAGLSADVQDELVMEVHEPTPLDGIEDRLTHPVLRELMLALAWELALADGRVDDAEAKFFSELASRLDVSEARAQEIQDALSEKIA